MEPCGFGSGCKGSLLKLKQAVSSVLQVMTHAARPTLTVKRTEKDLRGQDWFSSPFPSSGVRYSLNRFLLHPVPIPFTPPGN